MWPWCTLWGGTSGGNLKNPSSYIVFMAGAGTGYTCTTAQLSKPQFEKVSTAVQFTASTGSSAPGTAQVPEVKDK